MNRWVLNKKLHSSWLIAIYCLGIFVGVVIAKELTVAENIKIILLITGIIISLVAFSSKRTYLILALIFGGMLLGFWRGSLLQSRLLKYQPYFNTEVIVSGIVQDDVDIDKRYSIVIRLGDVIINGIHLPGVLYISANPADIKRGDELELTGKLVRGFGNFAGKIQKAKIIKVVQPRPGDIFRQARDYFANAIKKLIPEPEASLGVGFLLGQRRALPVTLVVALQAVGLTHIVVASGYNLTILVRLARRLFEKMSKYLALLSSLIMVFGFIMVTGASPSMVRAGLVAVLCLLAWYYGRKFHPVVILSIAVAVTVLINPMYAWGDLGWQLSFAAFAGVMLLAPLISHYFFGDKKPKFFGQILIETISAQVVTAPIIIMTFGQFSNVAVVSNLLVLPFVPIAMLLVFITGIGSLLFPSFIAHYLSLPAIWLLKYMTFLINQLADFPWSVSTVKFGYVACAVFYTIIIVAGVYLWRVTKYNLRDSNLVE